MIAIPFMKLHGAENDFILSWDDEAPAENLSGIARKICARTTGIGADGWMLVSKTENGLSTRLFNSDGSEPEISGNGTRCAAVFGILRRVVKPPEIRVETAAGVKTLRMVSRTGFRFVFEMDMGVPALQELHAPLRLHGRDYDACLLNVGNPQCAIFVTELPDDWRSAAAEAERLTRFPNRTNVSFVRILDQNTVDAVFYERGVGETRSSGTGTTGAATAAILRGEVSSPVEVRTPAGSLNVRWDESVYLTGPAEVIGEGRFFVEQ